LSSERGIVSRVLLALAAASITLGLFWVMQALVSVAFTLQEGTRPQIVDFVRLKKDRPPEEKKRERPDRTPPDQPPPPPQMNYSQNINPDAAVGEIAPMMDAEVELAAATNIGAGGSDRDVTPIVRVKPQYPPQAAQRGIEGWVELRFAITTSGSTRDVVVTKAYPPGVFDSAAASAVRKFKYNPKVVNGVAVERTGMRIRLDFNL
jgi:protein TonB